MSGLVLRERNSGILQEQEAVLPSPATTLFTLSQLVRKQPHTGANLKTKIPVLTIKSLLIAFLNCTRRAF